MPKSYSKQFSLYDSGLVLSTVEQLPTASASVAFTVDSGKVFREDGEIVPVTLSNGIQYMPWGGDNLLPYHVLNMIESDETLSTCQIFNAEVCATAMGSSITPRLARSKSKMRSRTSFSAIIWRHISSVCARISSISAGVSL